jgi:type I restriction-modification system DNA methylase subunit
MSKDQKKQLEQQLWNIANTLRGKMDADEFRDYILGFIFYKYAKNELISKVLAHLDKIDFKLQDVNSDVLGDAYEYLIGQFASGAGKKAGEFYTP